jgi:hypothetical protein
MRRFLFRMCTIVAVFLPLQVLLLPGQAASAAPGNGQERAPGSQTAYRRP